jgi:hypothetical protein
MIGEWERGKVRKWEVVSLSLFQSPTCPFSAAFLGERRCT